MICKNIDDPDTKESMRNYANSILIDTIGIFYSASIYTSFFFFFSGTAAYFYFTSSKEITPIFSSNSLILDLILLILMAYAVLYVRFSSLLKKGNSKRYMIEMMIFSNIIFIFSAIIALYGIFSKIPPFIPMADVPQIPPLSIEHLKIIPVLPLSWIVSLYTIVIAVVLLEFLISTKYIEGISRKIGRVVHFEK